MSSGKDVLHVNPSLGPVTPTDLGDAYDIVVTDGLVGLDVNDYFAWNAEEFQGSNGGNDNLNLSNALVSVKLYGRGGNDKLYGGSNDDLLDGGNGNDTLYGNGGGDILTGSAGKDYFYGGDGDDYIFTDIDDYANPGIIADGGDGDDIVILDGTTGGHFVQGTNILNIEEIQGSDGGNDFVDLSTSSDPIRVFGRGGDDSIIASGHNDIIRGGSGNDTIIGGNGKDFLFGDDGNDTIYVNDGDAFVFGGAGNDTVVVQDPTKSYQCVGYNWFQFENYFGNPGDDPANATCRDYIDFSDAGVGTNLNLNGRSSNDTFFGGAGNDSIRGGKGQDLLNGGAGNDLIYGGSFDTDASDAYVDTLQGGDGKDTLYCDATDVVNGGDGYDIATVHGDAGVHWVGYASRSVENVIGSAVGNDFIDFSDAAAGSYGVDLFNQNKLGLYVDGRGGNDTIITGAGDDLLIGNDGNELLRGGKGNDQLWGGGGNDEYQFNFGDGKDTIKDAVGVGDTIRFLGNSFAANSVAMFRDGVNLVIGYGTDTITIEKQFASNNLADWSYGSEAVENLNLDSLGLHIGNVNAVVQAIHNFDILDPLVSFGSVQDVEANTGVMSLIATNWV